LIQASIKNLGVEIAENKALKAKITKLARTSKLLSAVRSRRL